MSRQTFDNSEGEAGTRDCIDNLWRAANATVTYDDGRGTLVRRVVQPRVG